MPEARHVLGHLRADEQEAIDPVVFGHAGDRRALVARDVSPPAGRAPAPAPRGVPGSSGSWLKTSRRPLNPIISSLVAFDCPAIRIDPRRGRPTLPVSNSRLRLVENP